MRQPLLEAERHQSQGCCDTVHFQGGVASMTFNFCRLEAFESLVDHVHGSEARMSLGRWCGQDVHCVEYASFRGREVFLAKYSTKPAFRELVSFGTQGRPIWTVQTATPQGCGRTCRHCAAQPAQHRSEQCEPQAHGQQCLGSS